MSYFSVETFTNAADKRRLIAVSCEYESVLTPEECRAFAEDLLDAASWAEWAKDVTA